MDRNQGYREFKHQIELARIAEFTWGQLSE
jgi:hypothetical protein